MKKLLLASAISLAAVTGASAADLPILTKAPPVAPPVYTWTGFYLGGNVGGKWASTSDSPYVTGAAGFGVTTPSGTLPFGTTTAGTFIGGGQAGYNWQIGHIVLGVEGDIDAQHWSTTRTAGPPPLAGMFVTGDNFTATSNWQASLRGRIGYVWNRTLLYVTGGPAWTNVSVGTNFVAIRTARVAFPASTATDSATLTGATVGGGIVGTRSVSA